MNKKKYILIIIFTCCLAIIKYYNIYNLSTINNVESYLKKNNKIDNNLRVEKTIDIKDIKFVLFSDKNTLTYAKFKKGINGKFKFVYVEKYFQHQEDVFCEEIDNSTYIIYLGYNKENSSIKSLNFNINHEKNFLRFNIKNKKFFIEYKKFNLPSEKIKLIY